MTYRPGRHFLQIPGPTNVPDRILRAIDRPTIDHGGPEFADLGRQCLEGMKPIFKTKIVGPASTAVLRRVLKTDARAYPNQALQILDEAPSGNILVYVLLGAGFTKLMLNLWVDAAIIFGVVILNALLGFIQEGKAEKALESIRNMLSAEARTLRGGETRMIPAEEVVPGDIVLLESGDKIPADLRLADAKNLRTEEAALTGESVPADKHTDPVTANATVGDRECMAFSGTMVVSGRATGVVVATGSETELGRINQLLATVSVLETPLLRQIRSWLRHHRVIAVAARCSPTASGQRAGSELFQAVVGIAVSGFRGPAGDHLITLAIGVQRWPSATPSSGGRRRWKSALGPGRGSAPTRRHAHPHGNDGGLRRHCRVGL
jgi:hypothetical protein